MERREGVELRADGRTLIGAAIRYGDVSPSHRERFEAGALTVSPDLAPTLGHRTGRVLAYGDDVTVEDRADALIVSAHLPRTDTADKALDGVRSGRFRGWSVEFQARRETRDANGIRVIEAADLPGLALVDHPSYPGSTVEARRRRRIRSTVPTRRPIDCKCPDGANVVEFGPEAFRRVADLDVTAISRGAESVVAATSAGDSLALSAGADGALAVSMTPLDTEAGRRVAELVEAGVRVYARPLWDMDRSTWVARDGVAHVSRAWFAYLLVRPVPEADSGGLEPVEAAEARAAAGEAVEPGNHRGLVRVAPPDALDRLVRPQRPRRFRPWL